MHNESSRGLFVIASGLTVEMLPQRSIETRLSRTGNSRLDCGELARVPRVGNRIPIGGVLRNGGHAGKEQQDDEEESVRTDPSGWLVAPVGLRRGPKRTRRLEQARLVDLVIDTGKAPDGASCPGQARRSGEPSGIFEPNGNNGNDCPYDGNHDRAVAGHCQRPAGQSDRQERERSSRSVRPPDQRRGTRARQNLAISQGKLHA